jgi:hypothetical protein
MAGDRMIFHQKNPRPALGFPLGAFHGHGFRRV